MSGTTRERIDLETYCKQNNMQYLLKEWHPTKNGDLKPSDVSARSSKHNIWWLFSYDDPNTGKHFDFEWQATLDKRVLRGYGCPYLSGKQIYRGFNDLATTHPDLAKEWNPTKNGNVTSFDVTAGSSKKVWWFCIYVDSDTGKVYNFEWEATISSRVRGTGCPYLCGKVVYKGYNDLATLHPDIAQEWHPTRNGTLKPSDVTAKSNKKVWWLLPYDDPNTGKHFEFEWEAPINNRISHGRSCPYLSGQAVYKGYNDLETLYPEIAKEWHPTRNGDLTPADVTVGCGKKVWWLLPYDDPITGKHFDFEWEAFIYNRVIGEGCLYLCGKQVYKGFNDLATRRPELAKEWHPIRNGTLTPSDVTAGSHQKVWWLLPYDDPKTGKHFDFEWQATIASRVAGNSCPYLNGLRVHSGFNDLETYCKLHNREYLLREWHIHKNGSLKPSDITAKTSRKVWWRFSYTDSYTGNLYEFEWKARVSERVRGTNCPYLRSSKIEKLLYAYCTDNNIGVVLEKRFNTPLVKYYSYDMYLPELGLIIEADGLQHFQQIAYFAPTDDAFQHRVQIDNSKNSFCARQKIPILRIPYIYDVDENREQIKKLVTSFIETRLVPQEILDFYKAYKKSIGSNYYDIAVALNKEYKRVLLKG